MDSKMDLPAASARIEYLFDKFYREKCDEKAGSLYDHASVFIKKYNGLDEFHGHIDSNAMLRIAEAYFIDIIKYKEYHLTPKVSENTILSTCPTGEEWDRELHSPENQNLLNRSKIASFTTKWLLRGQPIKIIQKPEVEYASFSPTEQQVDKIWYVNEKFSISHLLSLLEVNSTTLAADYKNSLLKDLLYHFKYRSYCERHFMRICDDLVHISNLV